VRYSVNPSCGAWPRSATKTGLVILPENAFSLANAVLGKNPRAIEGAVANSRVDQRELVS
jgi:hypothetical protein